MQYCLLFIIFLTGCDSASQKNYGESNYKSINIPFEIRDSVKQFRIPQKMTTGVKGSLAFDVFIDKNCKKLEYKVKLLRYFDSEGNRIYNYFDNTSVPIKLDSYPDIVLQVHNYLKPIIELYEVDATKGTNYAEGYVITFYKELTPY
jgi:hypothetical protein